MNIITTIRKLRFNIKPNKIIIINNRLANKICKQPTNK